MSMPFRPSRVRHIEAIAAIPREQRTASQRKLLLYYSKLFRATPKWLTSEQCTEIKRIYRLAKRHGQTVDHIVPLSNPLVCGLHVPWNLQLMARRENERKANGFWPGCPFEQPDMLGEQRQLNLI